MNFAPGNLGSGSAAGGAPAAPEKKSPNVIVIVIVVAVLLAISVGAYYLFAGSTPAEESFNLTTSTPLTADGITSMQSTGDSSLSGSTSLTNKSDLIVPQKPNITGIMVGGLFIPSGLDSKALDFLLSLEAQGKLPVEVDPSGLGKPNPFAK